MSLTPYVHLEVELAGSGPGATVPLSEDDAHHLRRVLRLDDGARIEVADGAGRSATGRIDGDRVVLDAEVVDHPEPRPRLVLAQALPKGRKLDDVLRWATELGVDEVRPLLSERCEVRIDPRRADRTRSRRDAVVRAACEQARRPRRPIVTEPASVDRLGRDDELLLVAHPGAPGPGSLAPVLEEASALVLAVGPEGGFTDGEVADLVAGGALAIGFGPTVLRTEHAGPAGLAVLAAATGRWDQ